LDIFAVRGRLPIYGLQTSFEFKLKLKEHTMADLSNLARQAANKPEFVAHEAK
jgi:hypothetical protein